MRAFRAVLATCVAALLLWFVPPAASAVGVIDTINVGTNPYGIALTPDDTTAYVTNMGAGTISVVDLSTGMVSSTISVGAVAPYALAMSPDGTRVVVGNFANGTFSVIRTSDNAIVETVPKNNLCPNPTSVAYHPSGSPIYVGCGDFQRIATIDASTYATSILSHGSNDVDDVAVSQDASELVNAGGGRVVFINTGWSSLVPGNPAAVALSADGDTAYSANDDGTVTSLNFPTLASTTWPAGQQLRDIVISEISDRLYVTDVAADNLIIQRLSSGETLTTIGVGSAPTSVAINSSQTRAYVVNNSSNTVSVVDLTDGRAPSDATADSPIAIQLDPGSDATCSVGDVQALRGRWVALPKSDSCTRLDHDPNSVLVGWATRADFPVDIAQRQVDNGWGAYETFNDDGRLTGVFIPAGGATVISAPGRLHAIWSGPVIS